MDDMFFTKDERSLRRGKRVAKRTETCRPCILSLQASVPAETEGVVLDANPFGMLVRSLETIPVGTPIVIQLMRDDAFQEPFSEPLRGEVVRSESTPGGFIDHGVRLHRETIRTPQSRPVFIPPRTVTRRSTRTRMHTLDITIGGEPGGRMAR